LEEINKLVCVQTTEDGWIIDPVTGYIYDPVTGLPIDLTGGGNGSGTGGGNNNQPFLDCYNKFLSFIDYYQDKENKPEEYDILVQYLSCLNGDCSTCLTLPYTKLEGRECFVDFCDLTVPDLPEEEEEEEVEIPDFPEIDLGTGVDDTWDDEEPEPTELESDPFVQRGPVWWYHSDHLGSTSYITDILGMPCQYIEYLPFGEVMVQQSTNNIFENVYKFNGKELDESTGYYYYGARYYDPAISIFLSVDPLAEQFPNYNPYTYTMNNPVNLVDPTGMAAEEVIIKGEKKQEAFTQLQSSTKLKLTMDENGKVGTNDTKAESKSDKMLLKAINSTGIQVNVNATDSNYYSDTEAMLGGVYEGSKVDESGRIIASQTVNPRQMSDIDEFYEIPKGSTAKHEVLESYIGAVKSPGEGKPITEGTKEYKAYMKAHKKAMKIDKNYVQPDFKQHDSGNFFMYKPNPNPAFKFPKIKEINNLSR
jgi:RHS repeat-associated protein